MPDIIYIPLADYNGADPKASTFTSGINQIAAANSDVVDFSDGVEYVALARVDINGNPTYTQIAAATAPAQMAAPSLVVSESTQLTATLAADPADGGSPITSYDLRYSTDEATWTEVIGISSPSVITGLTTDTLYYVQTRAVNAVGAGVYSVSATETPVDIGYVQKFFDTNDTFQANSIITGTFNRIEFSCWLNARAWGDRVLGNDFYILLDTSGRLKIIVKDSANVIIFDGRSAGSTIPLNTLKHIYFAIDISTGTPTAELYIDGVISALTQNNVPVVQGTGSFFSGAEHEVLGTGTNITDGTFADYWLAYSSSALLGNAAFWNAGTPPDLNGVGAPQIWLGDAQTAAAINGGANLGSGTLTVITGTLTDVV